MIRTENWRGYNLFIYRFKINEILQKYTFQEFVMYSFHDSKLIIRLKHRLKLTCGELIAFWIAGRYVGSRPIKLRKSNWKSRSLEVVRKKEKEKATLIGLLTGAVWVCCFAPMDFILFYRGWIAWPPRDRIRRDRYMFIAIYTWIVWLILIIKVEVIGVQSWPPLFSSHVFNLKSDWV